MENHVSMGKLSKIFIIIPFFILLLQQVFISYSSGFITTAFKYFDELYIIVLWVAGLKKNNWRLALNKMDTMLIVFMLPFLFMGLVSAAFTDYQLYIFSIVDAYVCVKFILYYLGIRQFINNGKHASDMLNIMYGICVLLIVMMFVLSLTNVVVPIFPTAGYRYFMESIRLFFPHPTYLAIAVAICMCVIIAHGTIREKNIDIVYLFMGAVIMCLTLRSKAIAGAACILFIYFYYTKFKIKSNLIFGIIAFAMALYIGYDQLSFYFSGASKYDPNFIRERLHIDMIDIANRFFPMGSGFGTFASNIAAERWSVLYDEYDYVYNVFLSDSFWPIVTAQTGWIGLIIFVLILCSFGVIIMKLQNKNVYLFCAALSLIIYELICSVAESAFFNPAACALFMVLGIIVRIEDYYDVNMCREQGYIKHGKKAI